MICCVCKVGNELIQSLNVYCNSSFLPWQSKAANGDFGKSVQAALLLEDSDPRVKVHFADHYVL